MLVLAVTIVSASGASASSVRVPNDYFGTNLPNSYTLADDLRDLHLAKMVSGGITELRLPIPWSMIEKTPPKNDGTHAYTWGLVDDEIGAMARHGIRVQSLFAYAPNWAASGSQAQINNCRSRGVAGLGTSTPKNYAAAAGAVARRYGPNGQFWQAHPELTPRPIRVHEIWNAPNTSGTWCPTVTPGGYAEVFHQAQLAIRAFDPGAQIVIGGMGIGAKTQGGSMSTPEFLKKMTAAKPSIRTSASAMAIHLYPGKTLASQLNGLPLFREWLRAAGIPNTMPMLLNEIGFSRAGAIDMTEDERVASYANVMSKLPRTNCNLNGVLQYTWTTRDQNGQDAEDMFGIAQMGTAEMYPSGREFVGWTLNFRGLLTSEAPRGTLMICPGMPKPDQDRDGVLDESDYYPLDPARA